MNETATSPPPFSGDGDRSRTEWNHGPEILEAHGRWIDRFLDAALWTFENDRRQNYFDGEAELAKRHLVRRAGQDEEDVFVALLPSHHASLRQALDFGCQSITLRNRTGGAALRFNPSLRIGKRPGEFYFLIPDGVTESTLSGRLTVRPKTAYQVLVQFLQLLKEQPHRFPVHSAVRLFRLQEQDMRTPDAGPKIAGLNARQERARAAILANPFSLVWGPPGTGKSHLICSVVDRLIELGRTVLVTSNTNDAIDAVASRLAAHAARHPGSSVGRAVAEGRVTRYGTPQNPRHLGKVAYLNRDPAGGLGPTLANDACTIVTGYRLTSHLAGGQSGEPDPAVADPVLAYLRDVVVVDEISTVSVPLIYAMACTARRGVVLIGDPKQIPGVFSLRAAAGDQRGQKARALFSANCFDFLGVRLEADDRRVSVLTVQHRMFDDIAHWVRLTGLYPEYATDPEFERHPPRTLATARLQAQPLPGRGGVIIDTSHFHHPVASERANEVHADLGFRLLSYYHGLPAIGSIGIVAPFARQAHAYKDYIREHSLRDVHAGTVHAFQGGEANLIIWDTVLSPSVLGPPMSLHFFDERADPQALHIHNVAISRARAKIVVLANLAHWIERLSKDCFLLRLAKYCYAEGLIVPAERVLERMGQPRAGRGATVAFPEKPFELRFALAAANRDFMPVFARDVELARDLIQIRSRTVAKGPFLHLINYLLQRVRDQRLQVELFLHKPALDADCRRILDEAVRRSTAIVRRPQAEWRYNDDIDIVIDGIVQYAGVPALLAGGFKLEGGSADAVRVIRYVQHVT